MRTVPHARSSRARNLEAVAQYAPPHHDLMLGTRLLAHLLGRRVRAQEEDAHLCKREGGRAVQKLLQTEEASRHKGRRQRCNGTGRTDLETADRAVIRLFTAVYS